MAEAEVEKSYQFALLATLAFRNVLRNPKRSALTLLAIAIGVLSANGLSSLARGLSNTAVDSTIANLTGHMQVHTPEYLSDPHVDNRFASPQGAQSAALASSSIRSWSKRVRVPAVVQSERETSGVSLVGIDPDRERDQTFLEHAKIEGQFLETPESDGIVLGAALREQLRTRVGKRVVLMSQHADGTVADRGFRVIGVYHAELESTEKNFAFVSIHQAQEMLGMGAEISEIAITAKSKDNLISLRSALSQVFPQQKVELWSELEPFLLALLNVQNGVLYIWYVIVVVTISFGLVNTLFMAIFERSREIDLLQALGMYPTQIVLQILVESIVLLAFGALLGNILTFLMLWLLSGGIDLASFSEGTQMFGIGSTVYLHLRPSDCLLANTLVAGLGVLASVYPAWKAGRLLPARAFSRG